ncbi:DNA replication initiation factor [Martiniozyma asiatica (nom. inval.)]|nr:DNA replication initiation factor [Martiniozyma asiatica]
MILSQKDFGNTLQRIMKTSMSYSTCKLAIFVSCFSVDAICATRILVDILKRDFFVYQIIPVLGYMDLKDKYLNLSEDVTNVILLGCGATVDLESFLEIEISEWIDEDQNLELVQQLTSEKKWSEIKLNRKIYVIDGQRPWNLDNLYGSPLVCCLDDGSTDSLQDEETAFNFLINIDDDEEQENDDDDDDDQELEDLAETDDDNDNTDTENSSESRKRSRDNEQSIKKKRKTLINQYQDIVETYYAQGTSMSIPSSLQMYDIISSVGEGNLEGLWLAIVGTKSLRERYETVYEAVNPILKGEVNRLQSEKDSYMLRETSTDDRFAIESYKKIDGVIIKPSHEYTLYMLNHWTLYNSFFFSNYVNSKIHLYTNDGKRLLKSIFARMGISLVQANQNWSYIDLELKKSLDDRFERELPKFDLGNLVIPGFTRYYGFNGTMSSGDFVHSVTALLEYNKSDGFKINKNKKSINGEIIDTADEDDDDDDDESNNNSIEKIAQKRNKAFLKSFWKAFDALGSFDNIKNGLEIAKIEQQFIFERGSEILQKDMVKSHSRFKVVILNESFTSNTTISDQTVRSNRNNNQFDEEMMGIQNVATTHLFQNPLILTRLGNWILDVYSEIEDNLLPLVIGALDSETETYLICGLPPKTKIEDQSGQQQNILNTFSVIFERVTQEVNIQARIDSFQSAIIEIKKEDLGRFLEALSRSSHSISV